jgi:hypothetical protein
MANTTNFGWETPDDTDLVKDGAAAIRTLGSAIDTSLADLEGGTTGQVLAKNSNADMDFIWVTSDDANAIQNTIVDAKGDIVAASANDTPARLAVGTDNHRLVAASGEATGLKYVADTQNTVIDAAGDLVYGTAADTLGRLAIGTAGQVLKVNSGATAPEWGAAGGSAGLTLITKSPFTTVSSHSVDNCFTSTYANYKVLIKWSAQSADNVDLTLRLRASGSDTSTNYNCQRLFAYATTVTTDTDPSGNDDWIAGVADKDFAAVQFLEMEIASPQVATTTSMVLRQYGYTTEQFLHFVGGRQNSSTQFDGFKVLANTGTMSGTVWVYGYQEA